MRRYSQEENLLTKKRKRQIKNELMGCNTFVGFVIVWNEVLFPLQCPKGDDGIQLNRMRIWRRKSRFNQFYLSFYASISLHNKNLFESPIRFSFWAIFLLPCFFLSLRLTRKTHGRYIILFCAVNFILLLAINGANLRPFNFKNRFRIARILNGLLLARAFVRIEFFRFFLLQFFSLMRNVIFYLDFFEIFGLFHPLRKPELATGTFVIPVSRTTSTI